MSAGKRLRQIRDLLDLTQSEFGDKLGFKWSKIKDIESDKLKITPEIALQIEKLFAIDFRWLLTGDGEMLVSNSTKESKNLQSASDTSIVKSKNITINEIVQVLETMPDQKIQECLGLCQEKKLLYDLLQERLKKSAG